MACCSEYQNECLRVITIGYLKSFIGSNIQDSSGNAVYINYSDNTYCPTYGELTGGIFIQNWAQGSTPNGDRDGIVVNSTCTGTGNAYANNQTVDQKDLSMRYTRFTSFTVSSPSTDVDECGGTEQLSYVHTYTRYITSMNDSCVTSTTSSQVSDTENGEVSWTPSCNWVSVNQSTLVATVSTQPETRTADRRCCTVTGKITFRTTDHTSSTDVCQEALIGGYNNYEGRHYTGVTAVAATSTSFGCCGGTYGITGTGYFYDRYEWVDSCNRIYHSAPYNDVSGSEAIGGGGGGCTSCSINGASTAGGDGGTIQLTVSESASGDYAKSGTFSSCDCCSSPTCCDGCSDSASLNLTYHGLTSNSVQFSQSCSSQSSGCYSPDPDPPGPDTGDTGTTGTCTTCPDDKCGSTAVNKWYQGVNGATDTSNPCNYIITVHWCTRYSCSQSGCPDCCKNPQGNDSWVVGKESSSYTWTCPCNPSITTTVPAKPDGCD